MDWLLWYVLPMLIVWVVLILVIKYSSTWDAANTMIVSWGFVFSVIPVANVILAGWLCILAVYTQVELVVEEYKRR
jgi:uncharacterized membrane protein (DUF485 family)